MKANRLIIWAILSHKEAQNAQKFGPSHQLELLWVELKLNA